MNIDHDGQWFNTLIPPSHESSVVCCLSQLQRTEETYIGVACCKCKAGSGSSTLLVADRMWLL